ncbi:hypothetical protein FNF28_03307 [Cafeteria roenbergensis]|uniref:Ubiquitin carboxyl-terminal hydrolase n=1 Tax=Cafeteria roenbergensis TaxID=33653 RepID=A0A5A8DKE7_CAFRO|nr:hypothetical protein FNF28_03307 [Cafeteria roenbergensis]
MIPGLREALASRKAFVDETSESSEGVGAGATGTVGARRGSKFANVSFVEKSATGYTGLVNQGATCYLNSFLQMLFMTPDFRRSLFEWKFDEAEHGDARRCLAYQLQRLFAQLQLTTRGAVRTSDLTLSFGWTGSQAFVQHDVQECMTHVMDHLSMTAVGSSLGHHVMEEQQGRMRRYVLCHGCGHLSASAEVFGSVQVPIKGFANLQAALQGLVAPEVLDGTSKYNCSGCESEQAASLGRYFDGAALPLVLTLQLVRFDFDLATMQRRKLSDELPFPAELDMATLLQPPADAVARAAEAGSGEAFEAAAEAAAAAGAGEGTVYDLFAVMLHTGGAHGGHYSAFLKELRPAEEARGARWLKFNDSSVSEMSASDIRRAFGGTQAATGLHGACRLVRMRGDKAEVLASDSGEEDVSLRLSLKLQPGDSVFVDPTTEGPSPVVRLLESIANEVTISFEPLRPLTELEARGVAADCPGVSEADLRGEELDTTACSVQVDQRQTLGELRRAVEGATRATPGTVRVMRPGGFEMKDATKPLAFHGLLGGGKVRLERGRPLTPAEFTLKVVVFRSADEGTSGAGSEASRFTELGFVTADRETPVPQLKELIAARLSSAAVPIDPTRMRLRERTGRSLAGALLDCRTLAAALSSRIVDGREVVVQTLDHGEALEEGDLLINLRVWHPQEAVLDAAGPEIAVRASTTTEQLRALAAAKLGVPPVAVVMSKVSAFMLRDKAAIANLEAFKLRAGASAEAAAAQAGADALADRPVLYGRRQPADDACIASDPWRLRSGSTVVVKDGRAVETLQDHAGDGGKPAAATHGGRRAEIAFQIFTPQQQREREAEKARRAQEQREAAERAAAEAAKAVSNKPEHSIPGEADLRKFVMLFRGGVTEEGVKAKIKSEGFDEVRTFAKVLENLDMVTGSDE